MKNITTKEWLTLEASVIAMLPEFGLGSNCCDNDSVPVMGFTTHDDSDDYGIDTQGSKPIDVVLPELTEAELDELHPTWREESTQDEVEHDGPNAIFEKYSDQYHGWVDGFWPMMNFYWPVELAYAVSEQEAATRIAKYAPCCVLISYEHPYDETKLYGIALTGGGMDLSDHILAAYFCCGQTPPLDRLVGSNALQNTDSWIRRAMIVESNRSLSALRQRQREKSVEREIAFASDLLKVADIAHNTTDEVEETEGA